MDADEIIQLTTESIGELVQAHLDSEESNSEAGRRLTPRWPFPGTTQLWLTDAAGAERLVIGTCCNISTSGLGVRTDESLPIGATFTIAVHLPLATYQGKATVRHCTEKKSGYFVGMQFQFE